jgi:branched-chain amino acid transport system ATP-binding protein
LATIIQLQNITKKFGGLVAVNSLTMEVAEKSIHALIGPNGSGKTTTLNLIAGVLKPNEGAINYKGEAISNLPTYQIARQGIGRTFQNIKLFTSMTAIENVMVGGDSQTKQGFLGFLFDINAAQREEKTLREKAGELLNFLGMYHLKDELVKNLPYGRQKVLELGRTLMSNPDLILLDEPAAGLNPSERNEFVAMLDKLHQQGKTLLLIEHNMDVVMSISQKITVLNFGAKIAEGSPRDIQTNDEVIKAYLGEKFKQQKTN